MSKATLHEIAGMSHVDFSKAANALAERLFNMANPMPHHPVVGVAALAFAFISATENQGMTKEDALDFMAQCLKMPAKPEESWH